MTWHARLHGTGTAPEVYFTLEVMLSRHFTLRHAPRSVNDNRPHPTEWR